MRDDVAGRPAATAVLLRAGRTAPEVLRLRRSSRLAFHGGAWVFPGGRVDAGEGEGEPGARRAAVREAHEEAGLELDPAALAPLSHGTTPEGQPRRFATWFYVAALGGATVRVDGGEIDDPRRATAEEALAAPRAGAIELPPPTFVTLTVLAAHRSPEAAVAAAAAAAPLVYMPRLTRAPLTAWCRSTPATPAGRRATRRRTEPASGSLPRDGLALRPKPCRRCRRVTARSSRARSWALAQGSAGAARGPTARR